MKTNIFDNLLISAPNDNGGLFFIGNNSIIKIDSKPSTGIFSDQSILARGVQPSKFQSFFKKPINKKSNSFKDIHSILHAKNYFYLVATHGNQILKLDKSAKIINKWKYTGENDSYHMNSICLFNNRIIFSAFGDFRKHREYKNGTFEKGYVQDLLSGKKLITGLSQPHSLYSFDNKLYLANSEEGSIRVYNNSFDLVRSKFLNGYTRGIYIRNNILYVGISASRNIKNSYNKAKLYAVDLHTFKVKKTLNFDSSEIYDIQGAHNKNIFEFVVSSLINNHTSEIKNHTSEIKKIKSSIKDLEHDKGILEHELNMIHQSRSWKYFLRFRDLYRFLSLKNR